MLPYLLTQVVALLPPPPFYPHGAVAAVTILWVVMKRETLPRRQSGKVASGYTQECHFRLRSFAHKNLVYPPTA